MVPLKTLEAVPLPIRACVTVGIGVIDVIPVAITPLLTKFWLFALTPVVILFAPSAVPVVKLSSIEPPDETILSVEALVDRLSWMRLLTVVSSILTKQEEVLVPKVLPSANTVPSSCRYQELKFAPVMLATSAARVTVAEVVGM